MLRLRHLAAFAIVSSAFAARPAGAEGPDHAACFQKRQYDACFREGKARYGADAYEEAYEAYLEGFKLKPNYEVAGNLGNVELKLEKYAAAYTHLKYSLENLPPSQRGGDVENRLKEKLGEALAHVGGRRFDTDPTSSEVTIDGEPIGSGSLGQWIGIEPGERKLVVAKPGYTTVTRTLDIRAGSEEATSIVLVPAAETDPDRPPPKGGDQGPELMLPLVIAGGVVFAGAIGAGIGLHVAASGKASDREAVTATISDPGACSGNPSGDLAARCQQVTELADQENTFSNAGTGLLIGGAVVGAAIGIYVIVVLTSGGDGETDATGLTLVPSFGPTENGITLLGRF
jgi:hypothetical protein